MLGGEKRPNVSGPGTVVGANVKLVGTLSDASDVVIHGHIEGEVVSSQGISITETAYVKGPVTGEMVSISGKVSGSIVAKSKLEILPTGKVFGSITSKDLSIKSGAIFVGKCTMPEGENDLISQESEEASAAVEEPKAEEKSYEV